jgi:hypothetical protein
MYPSDGNSAMWRIKGAQGAGQALREPPTRDSCPWAPSSTLDISVQGLAQLYRGFALDKENGTQKAPTFVHAVRLHKPIELFPCAQETGMRQTVGFFVEGQMKTK